VPTLRWQPITTLVLSLFGLGVSIYLTITHFSPHALVCVSNSTFNCEKVTTSPQSEVFGIPVAILGLFYFVPMIALCLPASCRSPGDVTTPLRTTRHALRSGRPRIREPIPPGSWSR
jgi:uncharacterized membrane protein